MSTPKEVRVPGRGYRKKGGPGEFMRELFPSPRREGVSSAYPLTAPSTRKRSATQRPLADLNHRFTATVLWPSPDANTTSSRRADPACTATLRWFRLSSKR